MPSGGRIFPEHVVQVNTHSTEYTQSCLNIEQINFDDGFRQYNMMQKCITLPSTYSNWNHAPFPTPYYYIHPQPISLHNYPNSFPKEYKVKCFVVCTWVEWKVIWRCWNEDTEFSSYCFGDYNRGGGGWEKDSTVPPSSRNSKAIIANYNFDSPW